MANRKSKDESSQVAIVMGSQSDWEVMQNAAIVLRKFGIPHDIAIVSAHRTPARLYDFASNAAERGLQVIIAGAGGAAHLPGMVASLTTLPVLGVPVPSKSLDGLDSLLSIAQMPAGVPVGSLAIGGAGATNAGLMAVSILALKNPLLAAEWQNWRLELTASVALAPSDKKVAKKSKAKTKPKAKRA